MSTPVNKHTVAGVEADQVDFELSCQVCATNLETTQSSVYRAEDVNGVEKEQSHGDAEDRLEKHLNLRIPLNLIT